MTGNPSLTPRLVAAHLGELILKGRNRTAFQRQLRANLRAQLGPLLAGPITHARGRLLLPVREDARVEEVHRRLEVVYGIARYALVERHPAQLEILTGLAVAWGERRRPTSFAIRARRSDKRYPLTSTQLNCHLGAAVQRATGARVDLEQPQLTLHVDLLEDEALIYDESHPGAGGLPVGSEGQVTVLLSGGIDSPVAAERIMKRGCRVRLLHFHSSPFTSAASREKAVGLGRILARRQGQITMDQVPLAPLQQEVIAHTPARLRILLYRRFMLRIAEARARETGSLALVTGESLGQVASQTLHNLAALDAVTTMPVLRPLVGYDKLEIVNRARTLGTYDLSIQPHDDCCSFMMPRRVATRAHPEILARAEEALDVGALVQGALAGLTTEELTPDW